MKCDIIIPVWNQLEATRECIDSVVKNTRYPHRLILIDNGSGEETKKYLKELKDKALSGVLLIRNKTNLGFVKASNQGFRLSDAPYVCLMNNDTIAAAGWLSDIVEAMESRPEIGIANPSSNTSGQFPSKTESIDEYALKLKGFKGGLQELYAARGFCMVVKRQVIEKIGIFDESYGMGFFEETDYSIRARAAGFKIVRVKSSYVYHKESVTFKRLGGHDALFKTNEALFIKRWGGRLRIAYLVKNSDDYEKIDREITDLARKGHEVVVFLKKGLRWPVSIDHFGIRRIDINPYFFDIICAYKIFRRRKKKRIDIVKHN